MPLDELLSQIRRETDDQVTALLESARQEAETRARDVAATADRTRYGRLAALAADHRAALARAAEAARREGTVALLEARRAAVARVLNRVRERLAESAGDAGYLASVGAELDHATAVLGGRPGVLTASPPIAELAHGRAGAPAQIVSDPAFSGFRLRSADGRIEVDASLEERLRRLGPSIAIEVVRALEEIR